MRLAWRSHRLHSAQSQLILSPLLMSDLPDYSRRTLHRLKPPLAVHSVKAAESAGACIQQCLTVIQFGTVVHENKSPTISNQLKPIK